MEQAEVEEAEVEEAEASPAPRYDGPPKYPDWCAKTVYAPSFPGSESTDVEETESKQFDEQGRLVLKTEDEDGDGEADSKVTYSYDESGLFYTSREDSDLDGEIDRESQILVRPDGEVGGITAPGRMNRAGPGNFRFNEEGHLIGYRTRGSRLIGKGNDRRRAKVEVVGVFLLNEQGLPTADFQVMGTREDQTLPDIQTLRANFVHDPESGTWNWPDDADFIVSRAHFFRYTEEGNETVQVSWRVDHEERSVLDLDAILTEVGAEKPLTIKTDSMGRRMVRAPASDLARKRLQSLYLMTYEKEQLKEFRSFGPRDRLGWLVQQTHDEQGEVIERRQDKSALTTMRGVADGVIDVVDRMSRDKRGFITRKYTTFHLYPTDAELENAPSELRLADIQGLEKDEELQPDEVIAKETDFKLDERGNVLEETSRRTRAVRTYAYDSSGRVVEEYIDGSVPGISPLSSVGGRYNTQIAHKYDDKGRKTQTARTAREKQRKDTRLTDFSYDGDRLVEEVVREKREFLGRDREAKFKTLWKKRHIYDPSGRKIKTTYKGVAYDYSPTLEYKYDDQGRLITERQVRDRDTRITSYKYDGEGRVVEETRRLESKTSHHYRIIHEYNEKGMRTRSLEWGRKNTSPVDTDPGKTSILEYEYEDGRLVRELHTSPYERVTYTYECQKSAE
ncbi:MAG: RHS repeat domain-containing protein [Myxococcota bacterium]